MSQDDEKNYTTPQLRQAVDEAMAEAEKALEKARWLMVNKDRDGSFMSEDVHAIAMAQYETGKAREKFNGRAKERAAKKGR